MLYSAAQQENSMTRLFPKIAALVALSALMGCVDPSELADLGNNAGYHRGIDQDIEATHSGAATLGSESPMIPGNWR